MGEYQSSRKVPASASDRRPPWASWYGKARWKKIARAQLRREPLCRMCREEGRVTPPIVADHAVPHKGDPRLFWSGELQSLCFTHHSAGKRRSEVRGYDTRIGSDGWPTDPRHPVYKNSQ
jgi:5-methylcytosine-specific restriction protein A